MMTNAQYAHIVSGLLRQCARELDYLASGMWNPDFCTAEAKRSSPMRDIIIENARLKEQLAALQNGQEQKPAGRE